MIKDRPIHLLNKPGYRGIPAAPIAIDFAYIPDLIRRSIAELGGIQPMTGAMAAAAGGVLYDKPSAEEVTLHRALSTTFQLVFVVANVACLTLGDGVAKGVPYSLSIIPASKRDHVQIVDIDTVAALDIQKMLSTFEPSFLGFEPFTGNPSLFGPLGSFLSNGLENSFPDELGIVIGQYFLALNYDTNDVLTSPVGFPNEKAECKYQAHRVHDIDVWSASDYRREDIALHCVQLPEFKLLSFFQFHTNLIDDPTKFS